MQEKKTDFATNLNNFNERVQEATNLRDLPGCLLIIILT